MRLTAAPAPTISDDHLHRLTQMVGHGDTATTIRAIATELLTYRNLTTPHQAAAAAEHAWRAGHTHPVAPTHPGA